LRITSKIDQLSQAWFKIKDKVRENYRSSSKIEDVYLFKTWTSNIRSTGPSPAKA